MSLTLRRQHIWFKFALGPALGAALLPLIVALLHLMPPQGQRAADAAMAPGRAVTAATMEHGAHRDGVHGRAAPDGAPSLHGSHHATVTCGPPSEGVADGERPASPSARPHCPLCLWLQAFHILPPPNAPVVACLPSEATDIFAPLDLRLDGARLTQLPQARAPPSSPIA